MVVVTWGRLDDGYFGHPKVQAAGPIAALVMAAAILYCCRHLTDGYVPDGAVATLVNLEGLRDVRGMVTAGKVAARLVSAGLFEAVDGGYEIHDFLDYNPSRAAVLAKRAQTKRAGELRAAKAARDGREGGRFQPALKPAADQRNAGAGAGEVAGAPLVQPDQPRTRTRTHELRSKVPRANGKEWAGFTAAQWMPVREAWMERGFRLPPKGDEGDIKSQRGLLWDMAREDPEWLARAIRSAPPGLTKSFDVVAHVVALRERLLNEADAEEAAVASRKSQISDRSRRQAEEWESVR